MHDVLDMALERALDQAYWRIHNGSGGVHQLADTGLEFIMAGVLRDALTREMENA